MSIERTNPARTPEEWVRTFVALFDVHASHVALLALDGTVLAVNAAWRRYGEVNGIGAGHDFVGTNYLGACEAGVAAGAAGAQEAYVGLLDVLRNGRPKFTMVYACHSPARREWYRMWVQPQAPSVPAVIVAHQLVDTKPWTVAEPTAAPAGAGVAPGGISQAGRFFPG